jgi:hypothetical protein
MSDCVDCGASSGVLPPLPADAPKLPPPISVPLPLTVLEKQRAAAEAAAGKTGAGGRVVVQRGPDGARPPVVVRNRQSAANSAAATPGHGAKSVMDRLAATPAAQQLAAQQYASLNNNSNNNNNNKSNGGVVGRGGFTRPLSSTPLAPATVAEAATAAGIPNAAMSMNRAANVFGGGGRVASGGASVEKPDEFFDGLWKKHTTHADALKNDLQAKLQESMGQIKALDLSNLTKDGAFSGFDRDIDASRLTPQDVENAEFMKTESLSMPDTDLTDIPSSDFMAKRLADHQAKFAAATAAALQAANQPIAPRTTAAAAANGATQALSVAQAAQINQNLKTSEMKDRRTRYANQKREQMNLPNNPNNPNPVPTATATTNSKGGYTPLGTASSAPVGFGAATAAGGGGMGGMAAGMAAGMAGMGGMGSQLNDLTSQLKDKVSKSSPELSQQAELVQGLASQLQNWNSLANKMGSLQTYMGVFGKHVRLMLGVQDDARHYSVQHYRGPLLTLLDNDTVKWYRRNDIAQSFSNAGCTMTWQGSAPALGENNERGKRFQLEWHDIIVDSQQRPIAIGTSWNATSQRQNMAIARFAPDGKTLDASFYADPKIPGVGAIQSNIFPTESRGVQCLLTNDQMRLIALATVFDHDSQQLIGTMVALRTTDGKQDTAFGKGGTVGLTAQGYQGCVAVRMAQHPVTGDLLVLLRLQTANQTVNKLTSLFLKFQPDGTLYPNFTAVFVDGDNNPTYPNVWIATDITWSIPTGTSGVDAKNRSKDKIVVVGTIVSQLGDELSQPFVRQYWSNGQLDTTFGAKPTAVSQYVTTEPPASAPAPVSVEILDLKNDVSPPTTGERVTGTALFFNNLNDADDNETTGGLLATDRRATPNAKPPNVIQTISTTIAATSAAVSTAFVADVVNPSGSLSGLMVLTVPNSAVATAQRTLVYDKYIEVLGVAYDDVQGTYGVSFICQIDVASQNQNLMLFQLADVYQTTVAQNFAIDFSTGTRCIVGYALHNSTQVDSADAFLIKLDGTGKVIQKSRLSLGGEYFQALTAVAVDPIHKRFVSTGLTQTGKTIYTRLGCLIHGPSF